MSLTRQAPKLTELDEDQLRAFYVSCGLSPETIDKAIEARRNAPVEVTGHAARRSTSAKARRR